MPEKLSFHDKAWAWTWHGPPLSYSASIQSIIAIRAGAQQEEAYNCALECGHMGMIRYMVEAGTAAADCLFTEGLTPLYLAAQRGHADVCRVDSHSGREWAEHWCLGGGMNEQLDCVISLTVQYLVPRPDCQVPY
jgi:hypothetical protein